MCGYRCPMAERKKCADFLICKKMQKPGVNYEDRANAMRVICLYQQKCGKTGHMENTDTAKRCFDENMIRPAGEK